MDTTQRIVPAFHVASLEATAAWYERVLGWAGHFDTFDAAGRALFGSVALQPEPFVGFNLARDESVGPGPCAHGASWVYVADVDAVYRRVAEAGWPVEEPIATRFWGERLFRLRDGDGHLLVFVQSVEELGIDEIRERHRALQSGAEGGAGSPPPHHALTRG